MRDFKRMQNDPPEGVNGAPQDNDIMKWHAVIFGCVPAHTCAPPSHTRPIEAPRWVEGLAGAASAKRTRLATRRGM